MIENGYAKYVQDENAIYRRDLIQAESSAQAKFVGMWGACKDSITQESSKRKIEQNTEPTDPNCTIKGNISDVGYGKNYFLPGCPSYNSIKIDTSKGEAYFCTEKEALSVGFSKALNCNN